MGQSALNPPHHDNSSHVCLAVANSAEMTPHFKPMHIHLLWMTHTDWVRVGGGADEGLKEYRRCCTDKRLSIGENVSVWNTHTHGGATGGSGVWEFAVSLPLKRTAQSVMCCLTSWGSLLWLFFYFHIFTHIQVPGSQNKGHRVQFV